MSPSPTVLAEPFAAAFPLQTWRYTVRAEGAGALPPWPAAAVRGVVGERLLEAVCPFETQDCAACPRRAGCAWPAAFRPVQGDGRYGNAPAPYIVRWDGPRRVGPGDAARVDVTLVGRAREHASPWGAALATGLAGGLGAGRVPFAVERVERLPAPRVPAPSPRLEVRLATPLELRRRGAALGYFDLAFFFDRLLERLDALAASHGDGLRLDIAGVRRAARVEVLRDDTRAARAERYAPRHGRTLQARGFIGRLLLGGHLVPVLPLLALATRVGAGKGSTTTWGCGRIELLPVD